MTYTKKELDRLNEIEEEAIGNYLDESDFDISDWIYDENVEEWRSLKWKINGECPSCGETEKEKCEC